MDKLDVLEAAFEEIRIATTDWALTSGSEENGIWYVAGIVDVTRKLLEKKGD